MEPTLDDEDSTALAFVFEAARGCSGGQRRMRKLLFAWHNALELGGFDFSDLWQLDEAHREAALRVIALIARGPSGWYPEHYGYGEEMQALIAEFGGERRCD